jgi:hypothetical protein
MFVDTAICPLQLQCCYSDVKMLIMDIWLVIQMDEVRPAPNFSAAPLCDFGDPHGPDWFIDASSAAKWSASYGSPENRGLPPTPPEEYLQQFPEGSRTSKQREQKLRQRSKAASHWPQEH